MVKIMTPNKLTIMGSIIVIILIIFIPTTYRVIKDHQDNLYKVVDDKIIEAAKNCFFADICKESKITLKMLYENNFLEKVSDPISKEYYNELSYVKRTGNEFSFVVVD